MTRYTPLWEQAGSYAAAVDRRLLGALWPAAAVTGCAVSVSSGMTVNVAAGQVAVPTANSTGSVLCSSDAVEPVTLAAAPGAGTNRYDVVICQARGNDLDGGANNDFLFTTVTGTAAASPTVPATPANAVALANIYVPGGSASVTAGNMTDVRPFSTLTDPRRVLARVNYTAAVSVPTGGATLPAAPALIIPANRRLALTLHVNISAAAGVGVFFVINANGSGIPLANGGSRVSQMNNIGAVGGYVLDGTLSVYGLAAGSYTFQPAGTGIAGTANVANDQDNGYFQIMDIGPV